MLRPLILQTVDSLRISLNEPLMRWLQGNDQVTACTAKAAAASEWCVTLERINRMPPLPGDPSMQMLAKAALLSAAFAALEASILQDFPDIEAAPQAALRDQILQECARAWVYAERENPATDRFAVRLQNIEGAMRIQCGLWGDSPPPDDCDLNLCRRIA
jgi:hypothetical protein